jgi:2-keto-3-deoxy-L-rhamnonate aldolase RhmA
MNKGKFIKSLGHGTWISIGSPVITELASNYPFDWFLFDLEHGFLTESSLLNNMQAVRNKEIKQIVRIPSFNPALIAHVLDWGASGIMIPHVSNPEQAEICVQAMRYPPLGTRGYSSRSRSFKYGLMLSESIQDINNLFLLVQIENYEGVSNASSIAQVEGVDVLFVGPSDLKLDLSIHQEKESIQFTDALKTVADAAMKNNKQAGILIKDVEDINSYIDMGFTCMAINSDLGLLCDGYQSITTKIKNK